MSEQSPGTHRRRRRRATSAQGEPARRESASVETSLGEPSVDESLVDESSIEESLVDNSLVDEPSVGESPRPGPGAAPGSGPSEPAARPERKARRPRPDRDSGERGLRDLVGAGRSQLGVDGALRGRDVNRPTDKDLAEAEESLTIVRRHWKPADPS